MAPSHSTGIDREDFDRRIRHATEKFEAARAQRDRVVERLERIRQRRGEIERQRNEMRAQFHMRLAGLETPNRRAAVAILDAARTVMEVGLEELWIDYFALGGNATPGELAAMLSGARPMFRLDHDRLVVAMNERFADQGFTRPLSFWDGTR